MMYRFLTGRTITDPYGRKGYLCRRRIVNAFVRRVIDPKRSENKSCRVYFAAEDKKLLWIYYYGVKEYMALIKIFCSGKIKISYERNTERSVFIMIEPKVYLLHYKGF